MVKLENYNQFKRNTTRHFVDVIAITFAGVFLASCASTKPGDTLPPVEEVEQPAIEIPAEEIQKPKVDPQPKVGESALSLLVKARKHAEAGEGEQAAATLERAIRIEPDNPWLWHRLAVLRMQQKKWSQAKELAHRSTALAKGNNRVIGGNWLVISLSEEGEGNYEAAKKAKINSDAYLGKE